MIHQEISSHPCQQGRKAGCEGLERAASVSPLSSGTKESRRLLAMTQLCLAPERRDERNDTKLLQASLESHLRAGAKACGCCIAARCARLTLPAGAKGRNRSPLTAAPRRTPASGDGSDPYRFLVRCAWSHPRVRGRKVVVPLLRAPNPVTPLIVKIKTVREKLKLSKVECPCEAGTEGTACGRAADPKWHSPALQGQRHDRAEVRDVVLVAPCVAGTEGDSRSRETEQ